MKNIGDCYFADKRAIIILKYLSIVLIITGAVTLFFAYGFGMIGVIILVIGIITFFLCSSQIISDKEYDCHLNSILKTLPFQYCDKYSKKWEFCAFGVGSKCKKGTDSKFRTDQYIFTQIFVDKNTLNIIRHTINYIGETQSDVFTANISDVLIKQIMKKYLDAKFCYIEICLTGHEVFTFPVPVNNYDVEELVHVLST